MGWIPFPPESVWRYCPNGEVFRLPAILPNRAIWQAAQPQRTFLPALRTDSFDSPDMCLNVSIVAFLTY